MKLSIITTVYKAENDLPRLLDSMMAQKAPELEFFLIDNGSPDRCGEICREYAAKDPRFTIYTLEENIGYIRARNLGIEVCDGDYIGFCDSDDYLEPGGYDRAVERIRETDCDFYAAAYKTVGTDGARVDLLPFAPGLYDTETTREQLLPQLFGDLDGRPMLQGFMWKHIIRRSIITGNGIRFYEPLKPYEDQLFNIDVMKRSRRVYIDDTVLYNYIVNEQSITAKMAENFDAEAEWQRIRGLYEQKLRRCENETEHTALSNLAVRYTYVLALNMVKCQRLSRKESDRLLRKFDSVGTIRTFCRDAKVSGKLMFFVRFCLLHGQHGLLLWTIENAMKLRQRRNVHGGSK